MKRTISFKGYAFQLLFWLKDHEEEIKLKLGIK